MLKKLLAAMNRLYPSPDLAPYTTASAPVWVNGEERTALLYALLYLPEFVEVEGSILQTFFVLNAEEFPKSFIEAKNEKKNPLHELEDSFNYVETSYIWGSVKAGDHLTDEDDKLFAECVAEAWRGRLALLYPTRRFKVSVITPPESGDAYGVSFHELRQETPSLKS